MRNQISNCAAMPGMSGVESQEIGIGDSSSTNDLIVKWVRFVSY